jgi:hypothetical protein
VKLNPAVRGWVGVGVLSLILTGGAGCDKSSLQSGDGGPTGTGGAGDCSANLSGTWDVVAMHAGDPPAMLTGVIVVTADTFSFTASSGKALVYQAAGTKQASWHAASGVVDNIAIQSSPVNVPAGSVPLALGGAWMFSSGNEQCAMTVASGSVSGSCQGVGDNAGSGDWPISIPNPNNGRTYTATRSATMASQFGDFGGAWLASNDVTPATCAVTLNGNQMTSTCTGSGTGRLSGPFQLTVGANCVASGSTTDFELSARRR